jgi:hypothetical protein
MTAANAEFTMKHRYPIGPARAGSLGVFAFTAALAAVDIYVYRRFWQCGPGRGCAASNRAGL